MKRTSIVLAILTSCCLAQQDPFGNVRGQGSPVERDPFGDSGPPKDRGPFVPPSNIRVFLQYIEIAHTDLTTMMADAPTGAVLRTRAMTLVEKRTAKITDSAVIILQDGDRAYLESFREMIVPTEYGPPIMSMDPPPRPDQLAKQKEFIYLLGPFVRLTPSGWDTRNTGITVQLEPVLSDDRRTVSVILATDWVEYRGDRIIRSLTMPWGRNDVKMPEFRTQSCVFRLSLSPKIFELGAVLNHLNQAPVPAPATKVLLFVRCDVPGAPAK